MQSRLFPVPITADCTGNTLSLRRSSKRNLICLIPTVPLFNRRSISVTCRVVSSKQNHYDILGLSVDASTSDIKKAYRLLARKYHPDVNKDSQAGEVFKGIHLAYEVLSNNSARGQYDRWLHYKALDWVVLSMWVGSSLARFTPLPKGALITLMYMSFKLKADLN